MQVLSASMDDWWHKNIFKEHSKSTKCYYKKGQKKSDYEKLLEKSSNCTS